MSSKIGRLFRFVICGAVLSCAFPAMAKNMGSRLGIGYASQFLLQDDLPSLAMRYYPNNNYGLMLTIGVDTQKNASRFGTQLRILRIVFKEDNMNFYTAAGAGLISREWDNKTHSGFDVHGVFGAEFFFTGLENLGISFEAGVGVTSVSNEVRFRTIGDHPLRAGMIFYF